MLGTLCPDFEGVLALETGTAEVLGPALALAATVVNTAICFGLVLCLINEALDQSANGFCNLAQSVSVPASSPTPAASPVPTPGPAPGLTIPSVAGDDFNPRFVNELHA